MFRSAFAMAAVALFTTAASAQPLTVIHQAPRKPVPGKPPLLVLLHGFGANEKDLLPMAARLDPRFAVASPRAPFEVRTGSYSWMNGNGEDALENARRTVLECIDQIVACALVPEVDLEAVVEEGH